MFVDKTTITVRAGDGGAGCTSFRREKYIPKGGPDGGDGGNGGNVILVTANGEQSLNDLVFNPRYVAERGIHGKGKELHGRRGKDVKIKIPVGTVVRDAETGEILIDMDVPNQSFIVAHGGKGGKGNARFATSINRVPHDHEPGTPGEVKQIELELKTIADFGLVGYPNAGKSTFLRVISNARPKVAPYPFTTRHPVVGITDCHDLRRFSVADIPGLIDGASENIGLGHEFLRHIERTRVIIYMLDMAGVDGRDPLDDFKNLQKELEAYQKGLSKRPAIILANKMDLEGSEENLVRLRKKYKKYEVFPISAELGAGTENLREVLLAVLDRHGGPRQWY